MRDCRLEGSGRCACGVWRRLAGARTGMEKWADGRAEAGGAYVAHKAAEWQTWSGKERALVEHAFAIVLQAHKLARRSSVLSIVWYPPAYTLSLPCSALHSSPVVVFTIFIIASPSPFPVCSRFPGPAPMFRKRVAMIVPLHEIADVTDDVAHPPPPPPPSRLSLTRPLRKNKRIRALCGSAKVAASSAAGADATCQAGAAASFQAGDGASASATLSSYIALPSFAPYSPSYAPPATSTPMSLNIAYGEAFYVGSCNPNSTRPATNKTPSPPHRKQPRRVSPPTQNPVTLRHRSTLAAERAAPLLSCLPKTETPPGSSAAHALLSPKPRSPDVHVAQGVSKSSRLSKTSKTPKMAKLPKTPRTPKIAKHSKSFKIAKHKLAKLSKPPKNTTTTRHQLPARTSGKNSPAVPSCVKITNDLTAEPSSRRNTRTASRTKKSRRTLAKLHATSLSSSIQPSLHDIDTNPLLPHPKAFTTTPFAGCSAARPPTEPSLSCTPAYVPSPSSSPPIPHLYASASSLVRKNGLSEPNSNSSQTWVPANSPHTESTPFDLQGAPPSNVASEEESEVGPIPNPSITTNGLDHSDPAPVSPPVNPPSCSPGRSPGHTPGRPPTRAAARAAAAATPVRGSARLSARTSPRTTPARTCTRYPMRSSARYPPRTPAPIPVRASSRTSKRTSKRTPTRTATRIPKRAFTRTPTRAATRAAVSAIAARSASAASLADDSEDYVLDIVPEKPSRLHYNIQYADSSPFPPIIIVDTDDDDDEDDEEYILPNEKSSTRKEKLANLKTKSRQRKSPQAGPSMMEKEKSPSSKTKQSPRQKDAARKLRADHGTESSSLTVTDSRQSSRESFDSSTMGANNDLSTAELLKLILLANEHNIVWTKIKGHPYWPAQLIPMSPQLEAQERFQLAVKFRRRAEDVCVMYFGTCEVAFVNVEKSCIPWEEGMKKNMHLTRKVRTAFQKALSEVKAFCHRVQRFPRGWWCEPECMALASDLYELCLQNQVNKRLRKFINRASTELIFWAKVRGFPHWPVQVLPRNLAQEKYPGLKLNSAYASRLNSMPCMFFGTGEVAKIKEKNFIPFGAGVARGYVTNSDRQDFAVALGELWGYLQEPRVWPSGYLSKRSWWSYEDTISAANLEDGCKPSVLHLPFFEHIDKSIWLEGTEPLQKPKPSDTTCCDCLPLRNERACSDSGCLNFASRFLCQAETCSAGKSCANTSFHKRELPGLRPFFTADQRGWGLKALEHIKHGSFVVEYIGEIINRDMVEERLKQAQAERSSEYYIMDLTNDLFVDAKRKGNLSRFINSSCDPNCVTQKWTDSTSGQTHVGIFAINDIAAGTELTYNYCFEDFGLLGTSHQRSFMCQCGTSACCMLDADEKEQMRYLIGKRLMVRWDDGWYPGIIESYNLKKKKFRVQYDDGDCEDLYLGNVVSSEENVSYRIIDDGTGDEDEITPAIS